MSVLNRIYVYLECLLVKQGQNANSCDWLELKHTPDLELLRQASVYVARRHPAIQAASEFDGLRAYTWTRNTDAYPDIRFERCDSLCPDQLDDALAHNIWGEPLDHLTGPPWRLHVTEYNDRCVLQSITSHIFTCGKSANLISAELLRAYAALARGETLDNDVIDVADRSASALFTPGWSLGKKLWSWVTASVSMVKEVANSPVRLATNHQLTTKRGKTGVHFVEFGSDLWDHLRRFAKIEGISRHPFYLTAWAEALLDFNKSRGYEHSGPVKFMDNFSLRTFSDQNLDGFYDLCAPPYAIFVPYEASSIEGRKHLHNTVEDLKAGGILEELSRFDLYHKAVALLGRTFVSKMVISSLAKSPFILSNTGPTPPDILAKHPLDLQRYFSFPQLFPPGKIMLIITSTPDNLRAVFLWDEDAIDKETMLDDLIPRFRAALERSTGFEAAQEEQLKLVGQSW